MSMQEVTLSETVRLTKALDSLPTLPIIAMQIGDVVHSKNASVQQVAEILRTDPATSAKLLRLVNSPYFGIPGGVSDVTRAIPFVGFNTLYQLVLSITVLETIGPRGGAFDAKELWLHSLTVATAAREIATELKFSDPGGCFTAGLLHDMGKIALAKLYPEKLTAAGETMRTEGVTREVAELRHGIPPHDQIGSRLARQWRFPATLATPIEQHHLIHRVDVRERLVPHLRTLTEIVAAADHLAPACQATFDGSECDQDATYVAEMFERNGMSAGQRTALCDRIKTQLERSKVFLSLLDS